MTVCNYNCNCGAPHHGQHAPTCPESMKLGSFTAPMPDNPREVEAERRELVAAQVRRPLWWGSRDESFDPAPRGEAVYTAIMALYDALRDSTARGKEEKRDPKGHVLYKRGDKDAPDSIKDSNGDIALGLCRNCHRGEIELDEPCDAKPTPVADKEEKRPIRHSEKLGELSPQAREDRLPRKPLWAPPCNDSAAPSLDAEVEELAKVLRAERNPDGLTSWSDLSGSDETGVKKSEKNMWIGLASAALRWFRNRPAKCLKCNDTGEYESGNFTEQDMRSKGPMVKCDCRHAQRLGVRQNETNT